LNYIGDVRTLLGVGYPTGSTKGIGKTYWTKLTSFVEEEKKGVS